MSKTAVIAGSSGLVGNELLHRLCASDAYSSIKLLVRRPSGFRHARVSEHIVDFDHLDEYEAQIAGDVLFCCLGTTKKKTPDKRAYYHIDHDYPLHLAEIAARNGFSQYHLISSIGADPRARTFYLRVKGETERDIAKLPLPALHIYRPSFLEGNREERRPLERFSLALLKVVQPLMAGGLKKYRSIHGGTVAEAMLRASLQGQHGRHCYESDRIQQLGQR